MIRILTRIRILIRILTRILIRILNRIRIVITGLEKIGNPVANAFDFSVALSQILVAQYACNVHPLFTTSFTRHW